MNYVCTYMTDGCMPSIEKVFIPSLKKNFKGQLVIHTFGISHTNTLKLQRMGATLLSCPPVPAYTAIGKLVWDEKQKFLKTLQPNDRVLFIDGADIFFQESIDKLFTDVQEKIGYTLVDNCDLVTIKHWSDLVFGDNLAKEVLWTTLKEHTIANMAFLMGTRDSLAQYLDLCNWFVKACGSKFFWGIEVITFNYLRRLCSSLFLQLDNVWCYDYPKDAVKLVDGIFKTVDDRVIKIAHFNLNDCFYSAYFLQGKR